jgi:molybdate transport system substrate-binding protein
MRPKDIGNVREESAMVHRSISLLIAPLGASILMFADAAIADDIRVMSSNAFRQAYLELVPEFEKQSGHKVVTDFVGGVILMKRLKAGETTDLVIAAGQSIDELIAQGKIAPGSRVDLARAGVGVAVRAGAAKPDVGSADALKRALVAAKSIGYSTGASGVHLLKVFERMGIAAEVKAKIRQAPPGEPVGGMVARGEVEIGFQQLSELLPVAGIEVIGMLPPDYQEITVFSAGVHAAAKDAAGAKALAEFLAAPAAAPVKRRKGMEPA